MDIPQDPSLDCLGDDRPEGENASTLPATASPRTQSASASESADAQDVEELPGNWYYVAASPAMREVREQVRLVAKIDVPVLLLGESGTGKEVIARLIHKHSLRAQRTFMKVNCTALPVELLESELFGYEAGAFTGARQNKPGKFEICHKGTILLDEIAEMPIPPQAKLLHVLQDGEFSRLGSPTPTRVDVRVLAATNLDIAQALDSKRLRSDLYYRLNAFTIQLPPLRARRPDIPILLNHFVSNWAERFGRPNLPISDRMMNAAVEYSWPGNVRELENFVKCYLVLGDEERVLSKLGTGANGKTFQFESMRQVIPNDCSDLKSLVRGLKQGAEKEVIVHALAQTRGSRKEAASMLKISLRALQYKIREYGIDQAEPPQSTPHAA